MYWRYTGTPIFWSALAMVLHWYCNILGCICNDIALAVVLHLQWCCIGNGIAKAAMAESDGLPSSEDQWDKCPTPRWQMEAVITDISLNVNCQLSSRKSQQLNISARSKCNCKICGLHNCFKISCKKLSAQEYSILMHNMQWPSNSGRSQRKPLRSSTLPTPSLWNCAILIFGKRGHCKIVCTLKTALLSWKERRSSGWQTSPT